MKKLKDLNFAEIKDENAFTLIGGAGCGTATERTVIVCNPPMEKTTGDWDDEGCCNT